MVGENPDFGWLVCSIWYEIEKLLAPMADLTVRAAMAGLTNFLWAPMDDLTEFFPSPVGTDV